MHRSGTSVLSGALYHAGVYMGENLTPGRSENPKGFFEDDDVWRLNEEIMWLLGRSWNDPRRFPEKWMESNKVNDYKEKIAHVLKEKFSSQHLWGIKDPRICRLVPLWKGLFESETTEVCYVISVRHPYDVYMSMNKRESIDIDHSFLLWIRSYLDLIEFTEGAERKFVFYDDLIESPVDEIQKIAHLFNIKLVDGINEKLDSHVDKGLRHNIYSKYQPNGEIQKMAVEIYHSIKKEDIAAVDRSGNALCLMNSVEDVINNHSEWMCRFKLKEKDALLFELKNELLELEAVNNEMQSGLSGLFFKVRKFVNIIRK